MKKQRTIQLFTIAVLTVMTGLMMVAFASYSQELRIDGTTDIASNKWSVHFDGAGARGGFSNGIGMTDEKHFTVDELANVVTFDIPFPEINYVYYAMLPIVNDGSFDAELVSLVGPNIAPEQHEYLRFAVYLDGLADGRKYLYSDGHVHEGITKDPLPIAAGETLNMVIEVGFIQPDDPSKLPTKGASVPFSFSYTARQKDSATGA